MTTFAPAISPIRKGFLKHPQDTGVTPTEYAERAVLIIAERPLKPHQLSDLTVMVKSVTSRGWVSKADLYYLEIVGIDPVFNLPAKQEEPKHLRVPQQEKLF